MLLVAAFWAVSCCDEMFNAIVKQVSPMTTKAGFAVLSPSQLESLLYDWRWDSFMNEVLKIYQLADKILANLGCRTKYVVYDCPDGPVIIITAVDA